MSKQTVNYSIYIKETEIDKFIEYLFPSELILETQIVTVPIKGKNVKFDDEKKNELKEYLKEPKEIKT